MTAPALDTDAPIPDDLLAQAFANKMDRNPLALDDAPDAGDSPPAPTDAPEVVDPPSDDAPQEPDSTTPADATTEPVDPVAVVDPFATVTKDAVPLAYRVNGTDRTMDAILELPNGKGGFIPADKLADVRNVVARYESNEAFVREYVAERKQYEALGGIPKFHEMQEQNAQLNAASVLILDAITKNPLQFVQVAGDQIVPNQERIQFLIEQAAVHAQRARFDTLAQRSQAQQTFAQTQTEEQVRQTAVPNAIAQHFADVHPDDRAHVVANAKRYLYPASADDAQRYNVRVGELMVDLPQMQADFAHLKSVRGTSATATQAAAKAAQFNARVTPKAPPVAAKPKAKPLPPRGEDGKFVEGKPKYTREDFMLAALAGKPTPGTSDDE